MPISNGSTQALDPSRGQVNAFEPLEVLNGYSLPKAAAYYASLGWHIFPLQPGKKRPFPGWSWVKAATSDIDTVRSWWAIWPNANIGLHCGAESNIDVFDLDTKNGENGLRSYQAIAQEPYPGPYQVTPSGGQHLPFLHTPGLKNFTHRGEFGGLDMRTDHGYIVLAPSVVNQRQYQWAGQGLIPSMPIKVQAECEHFSNSITDVITEDIPEIPEDLIDWRTLNLKEEHQAYLGKGETGPWGNDESKAIFSVAGALMHRLNDAGQVYGLLLSNDYAWATADRHTWNGSPEAWLWKYGIGKIVKGAERQTAQEAFSPTNGDVAWAMVDAQVPEHLRQVDEMLARRHAERGTQPSAPQGAVSFTDLEFTGGRNFLIDELIPEQGVGVVFGDTSSYKSFLTVDMAACVATGRPFHGQEVSEPGLAVYFAGEGYHGLKYRFEAWRREHGVSKEEMRSLYLHGQANLLATGGEDQAKAIIHQAIAETQRLPGLIVVDTLSTFSQGSLNSPDDTAAFIGRMQALAQFYGCAVLVVHHIGHDNKHRTYGGKPIEANSDYSYRMERKLSGIAVLEPAKQFKEDEPPEPWAFTTESVRLEGIKDRKHRTVTSLVLKRKEDYVATRDGKDRRESKRSDKQAALLAVLEKQWDQGTTEVDRNWLWENTIDSITGEKVYSEAKNCYAALNGLAKKREIRMDGKVVRKMGFSPIPTS